MNVGRKCVCIVVVGLVANCTRVLLKQLMLSDFSVCENGESVFVTDCDDTKIRTGFNVSTLGGDNVTLL